MLSQHLFNLETHGVAGIERGHRVLKDHGQILADHSTALAPLESQQILASELEAISRHFARRIDQSHQGHHRD